MNITEKALLVKISVSMPSNVRKDRDLTSKVKREHNMGKESGRWLKQLYPDEAFDPLLEIAGKAREYHEKISLPWKDAGWRILPASLFMTYAEKARAFKIEYANAVESHFLAQYDKWVDWARQEHNGTFNAALYPGVCDMRPKFGITVDFSPVPSAKDFRVQLSAEEMGILSSQVEDSVNDAVREAQRDLWKRLSTPLAAMVEKLREVRQGGKDPIFRDSLVENITEICGLIPTMNIAGDQSLEIVRQQVQKTLAQLNPQTLRSSKEARSEAAKKAEAILKTMVDYAP